MMDGHGPAMFLGDALALDFLNSIATPVDTPIDWIDGGEGLIAWLEQAELVPAEALRAIRALARPGEFNKVALQARDLREWFRGFVQKHKGRPLVLKGLSELEPLNRLLERDEMFTRVVLRPEHKPISFALQTTRRWRSPEALLLPIGEALARFICTEDFSHVKACEGPTCTLLFADHTHARARRWCNMAICGNRAKQAAHRNRRKTHQQGTVPNVDPPRICD
jgi:predicted RNA-binding Zn ribbon-like protein